MSSDPMSSESEKHHQAADSGSDKHPDSLGNNDDAEKGLPADGEAGINKDVSESQQTSSSAQPAQQPAGPPGGPGPVPNGGTQAWLQVLGGWMLFFNTW